jgi:hypothetical protein
MNGAECASGAAKMECHLSRNTESREANRVVQVNRSCNLGGCHGFVRLLPCFFLRWSRCGLKAATK